jgi:glutamine cyclotransferase
LGGGQQDNNGKSIEMSTFKFPDIFEITYLTKGKQNKHMIRQVESYLTAVSVTYNQTSPTFFADGMPSEVDLQLTFQESKALNRNMIQKGGY